MTHSSVLTIINGHLSTLPARDQEEVMHELADHLEDKAAHLRAQGHPNADAAAGAAFGDPSDIGSRLAGIHSRPNRWQIMLAVLPFLINGILIPLLLAAVVLLDQAMGSTPAKVLRILKVTLNHQETVALLALGLLAICGLSALVVIVAVRRGLPLWSASWLGNAMLGLILFLQLALDEMREPVLAAANMLLLVGLTAGLIVVARQRSALLALAIALSTLLQIRIFSFYALLDLPVELPVGESLLGLILAVLMTGIASLATIYLLRQRSGGLTVALVVILLSLLPDALWVASGIRSLASLLIDSILPAAAILIFPYLLGRRSNARVP